MTSFSFVARGRYLLPIEKERIVHALAQGEPIEAIAKRLHHGNDSVLAVRNERWEDIASRKLILAAQAERGALLAGERLLSRIPHLPDGLLLPTYGVFVDKSLALRGDTQTLHVEHTHTLSISGDDLIAFAVHRANSTQPAANQPKLVQAHTLPDSESSGDSDIEAYSRSEESSPKNELSGELSGRPNETGERKNSVKVRKKSVD